MIDKSKLTRQFDELDKYLKELEGLKDLSRKDYLSDNRNIFSLRYLLQVSIETCINISNHIISRYKLGIPNEYADVFRILEKKDIINLDLKSRLIRMVRFRNRLEHVYWEIDDEVIFNYLQDHLKDFYEYKKAIFGFLEKSKDK